MLSERDLEVADAWIRKHVVDTGDYDFDDVVEEGHTVKYWFHRCDRASVVFVVTVKRRQLFSIKKEVYREETQGDRPDEVEWVVEGGQERRRRSRRGNPIR